MATTKVAPRAILHIGTQNVIEYALGTRNDSVHIFRAASHYTVDITLSPHVCCGGIYPSQISLVKKFYSIQSVCQRS